MPDRMDSDAARTLVDDVQRLGADSADLVAERFSALMAGYLAESQSGAGTAPFVSAIADAVGDLTDAAIGAIETAVGSFDGGRTYEVGQLRLASRGREAAGEFWLHNTTAEGVDLVTPTASSLVGAAVSVDAAALTFTPAVAMNVAAGSSVRFVVSVDTAGIPSGRYHGVIAAVELPGPALPLIVEVGS